MKRTRTAAISLAALLLAACGTRLPDSAFVEDQELAGSRRAVLGGDEGVALEDELEGVVDDALDDGAGGGSSGGSGRSGSGSSSGGSGGGSGGSGGGSSGPNQPSDVGITATSITIGTIVAENGVLGDAFAPAARGMRAWTQHVNSKGGIHGRKVILKTCDDREDRARALACAKQLVEQDKVFALVATNTRAFGGAAQYLHDKAIPVIGIPITNSFYRYPHMWSAYPNSYPRDGKTVGYNGQIMSLSGQYRWFKTNLGVTKAAVFAYDIDESKQAGNFIAKGLELEGFEVTSYAVSFAAPSFDQAVADMQNRGTQIVFDAMDDGANRKLCDSMARRQFSVTAKVSTIVSFGDAVGNNYNDTCRNSVFIVGESIPYSSTDVPAVAEFRSAFAKYQPGQPVHQWALEAWSEGVLFADAMRSMGPTPTRKGLEDFLRALRDYKANGMLVGLEWGTVDYSKPTWEDCFSIARWLDSKGGWVRATDKFPYCVPDAKQYGTTALEQGD